MARRSVWVVLAAFVAVADGASAQPPDLPRLAIADFEVGHSGSMLAPPQLGATMAQLMLHRLVDATQFHVYDPQFLHSASTASRSYAAENALRTDARQAGVDYLVLGAVTQFSMEQKQRGLGGGGVIHGLPVGALGGRQTSGLCLSIVVRVVDVRTGEVVTTATGVGDGRRSRVSAGALVALLPIVGGFTHGSSNARDAQLAEATRQAVDAASTALVHAAPRLASARVDTTEERRSTQSSQSQPSSEHR
jgi:curli biogenesis system outer membrane secretion channel CsgG